MSVILRKWFLVFLLIAGGFALSPAYAQDDPTSQKQNAYTDPILGTQVSGLAQANDTSEYVKTTYQNLAKLYWALGKFYLSDTKAVDNYLQITECDLYRQYYHDDFQWNDIRNITKNKLQKERLKFPTKFEMMLPLTLGRYNVKDGTFSIENDTKFSGLKRVDMMADNKDEKLCTKIRTVSGYPIGVILYLNQPFTLEKIPVKPEIAALYIKKAKEKYASLPPDVRLVQYEREAYLRVLMSFDSYARTVNSSSGQKRAVVHGNIDGIQVYADVGRTEPLYIKDYKEVRRRIKTENEKKIMKDEVDNALSGFRELFKEYVTGGEDDEPSIDLKIDGDNKPDAE